MICLIYYACVASTCLVDCCYHDVNISLNHRSHFLNKPFLIYFMLVLDRYGSSGMSPGGQITNVKLKATTSARWRRVVLKISGSALAGTAPQNIDPKVYYYCLLFLKIM